MTVATVTTRAIDLVRDLWLALGSARRHVGDDLSHFTVQAVRKLQLGRRLPLQRGPLAWQVVSAHLADRSDLVDEMVVAWAQQSSGTRLLDRLAADAAQHRGHFGVIPPALITPQLRARERLAAGDLATAIELLDPTSGLRRRAASELSVLSAPLPTRQKSLGSSRHGRRVLHVLTNSLPHTQSGYTRRSQAIMTAQRDLGWHVEAATRVGYPATIGRFGTPKIEVVDGVAIHRLLPWHLPSTTEGRLDLQVEMLDTLVAQIKPSILHTTTDHTNGLAVAELAARRGLPWVYEMRGQLELTWLASRPDHLQDEAASSERLRLQRDRETSLAHHADAVVALSQVQRDDLIGRGVAADRIIVVPNAVSPSLLTRRVTNHEARATLALEQNAWWVGAVSSLVDYEGFDVLLDAVALLRTRGHDVRCALVGEGVSRASLQHQADELGIADACVFPGRVSHERAITWVEALDLVVVPRRDTPVCRMVTPLKPVEAWALGRPVVGSDLPALSEVVGVPGGRLAPAGDVDALASAITDTLNETHHDRRHHNSDTVEQGRAWAAQRTWQAAAHQYDQLYARLGVK